MNEIYEKIVNKHNLILNELEEAVILHKLKNVHAQCQGCNVNKHDMILTELEEAVILHKLKTVEKEATYTTKKIEDVIDYWCKHYELERSAAEGGSRVQNLKMLRYCIFWSIKKKVVPNNLTMEGIGKIFNRHHSTVIHAMKAMEDWIKYDSDLRQDLMVMLNEFGYRADWNEPLQELTFIRKGELYPSRL